MLGGPKAGDCGHDAPIPLTLHIEHGRLRSPEARCGHQADGSEPSMSTYAIIKTGGKQYRVEAGQQLTIEKLPVDTGSQVVFDQVLLLSADGSVRVGQPIVAGATVTGTVVEQTKDNKILVHKYRRRKNSRKTIGHRQPITRVRISAIQG